MLKKSFKRFLLKSVSDYLRQCDNLKEISEKIVPKISSTFPGIQAAKILESKGLATLVTTVCSIGQAYACASAEVTTICPYYSRLQDAGEDADKFLYNISSIYKTQGVKTKIIPASVRTLQDVEQALKNGSLGVIVFSELFRELFQHQVTSASLNGFDNDWEEITWQDQ